VPAEEAAGIKKRVVDNMDDLARPLGAPDTTVLADKVCGLAAQYLFAKSQTTLAVRKVRVAKMLNLFSQMDHALDLVKESMNDDPQFFFSPVAKTVVEAMRPVIDARDLLAEEHERLGRPCRADGRRVENPTQWFLVAAEILWMEETGKHAEFADADGDFRVWLSLLFEIVTGEPGRSFDKALRNC
jgi:hypothetical protein